MHWQDDTLCCHKLPGFISGSCGVWRLKQWCDMSSSGGDCFHKEVLAVDCDFELRIWF